MCAEAMHCLHCEPTDPLINMFELRTNSSLIKLFIALLLFFALRSAQHKTLSAALQRVSPSSHPMINTFQSLWQLITRNRLWIIVFRVISNSIWIPSNSRHWTPGPSTPGRWAQERAHNDLQSAIGKGSKRWVPSYGFFIRRIFSINSLV